MIGGDEACHIDTNKIEAKHKPLRILRGPYQIVIPIQRILETHSPLETVQL